MRNVITILAAVLSTAIVCAQSPATNPYGLIDLGIGTETITETDPVFSALDKDYTSLINEPVTSNDYETKVTSNPNMALTGIETNLKIGDRYQGGIIFWLDESGQHGLIAATNDIGNNSIRWNNGKDITIGTYANFGSGKRNTELIISKQGEGFYAAKICADYQKDGYDDWFLPSKDELNLLYNRKKIVGNFAKDHYWSSSEYNDGNAWMQYFGNAHDQSAYSKDEMARVRAIRKF